MIILDLALSGRENLISNLDVAIERMDMMNRPVELNEFQFYYYFEHKLLIDEIKYLSSIGMLEQKAALITW